MECLKYILQKLSRKKLVSLFIIIIFALPSCNSSQGCYYTIKYAKSTKIDKFQANYYVKMYPPLDLSKRKIAKKRFFSFYISNFESFKKDFITIEVPNKIGKIVFDSNETTKDYVSLIINGTPDIITENVRGEVEINKVKNNKVSGSFKLQIYEYTDSGIKKNTIVIEGKFMNAVKK